MAAPWLADALRAGGVPVYEQPGWQGRGTGGTFTPLGVLLHHTAGPRSGNLPSLGIVRNGRSDLQGPLAQLMLARDGVYHVIAAGRANHAGVGAARFVPANDGNRYLVGIEAESCGLVDDWTPEQRANYPKGVAALCRAMGVGEGNVLGHKEWAPTRKIDPAFWDMNGFRAVVRGWLRGSFVPAAPPSAPHLGEPLMRIDLEFYNDDWQPDPCGLNFRASAPAEAGDNSACFLEAYVRWSAHWGGAKFRIVAWDATKPIAEADVSRDNWSIPRGTRSFTVEGRRENAGVQVGASLIVKAK